MSKYTLRLGGPFRTLILHKEIQGNPYDVRKEVNRILFIENKGQQTLKEDPFEDCEVVEEVEQNQLRMIVKPTSIRRNFIIRQRVLEKKDDYDTGTWSDGEDRTEVSVVGPDYDWCHEQACLRGEDLRLTNGWDDFSIEEKRYR